MLFGAHAFIWAGEWTPEGAEKVIGGAAKAGLDFVEIPLLRPESMDGTATRALLDRYGIGCTCSLGLPKAVHMPSAPEKAESFLESAVDVAAGLEVPVLCGALYAHLGTLTGRPPEEGELKAVARVLKNVAVRCRTRSFAGRGGSEPLRDVLDKPCRASLRQAGPSRGAQRLRTP